MAGPRIGITRAVSSSKPVDQIPSYYHSYHARVREAGGEPVDLPAGRDPVAEGLFDTLDGVLIPGGADVNPTRYGERRHPQTVGINDDLDELELVVIRASLARDLPVFAICRGHQALNVACGGALLQHIEGDGHRAHDDGTSRFHDVTIAAGSRLASLLGQRTMPANSRHHQAVTADTLAPGLVATAWSPDGLIEGLESPAHQWVVGVQWHPERDEVIADFRPLFEDFIRTAGTGGRARYAGAVLAAESGSSH